MRNRSRSVPFQAEKLGESVYIRGPYANVSWTKIPWVENWNPLEYKRDACIDDTKPGPPYKEVNPLDVTHLYNPGYYQGTDGSHWESGTGDYERRYVGRHWVNPGIIWGHSGLAGEYQNTDLDVLGAQGWNRFQPARPVADVGVMLGESRELPRLLRDSVRMLEKWAKDSVTRHVSYLSNAYLCQQFGWLPLMRDLEKCHEAMQKTDSWMRRVRKYNGIWEHRGGTIAQGETTRTDGSNVMIPGPTGYSVPPEGVSYGDVRVTEGYRVWFSAWFKYFVNDFDSAFTQLRLRTRIWGLNNTPAIVWNLLPWSWLVDWFSNYGSNIENLVPIDGLVAKMACVMCHTWTRRTVFVRQRYVEPDGSIQTIEAQNFARIESKRRGVASPFGFGLTPGNFTGRQLAILAALGLTRASRISGS